MTPAVALEGVSRTYVGPPRVEAVRDVDLAVTAGEGVAIVGPSGSGKSTLLHLLGALDRPTSGRVTIDGVDTSTLGDRELSRLRATTIGFVFQQFHLVDHRSALDNVADALRPLGVPRARRAALAADALGRVGLADRGTHRPTQLSGGEQQRVALARALVGAPRVVLADEPTGNLDSDNGRIVLDLLGLARAEGTTVVLITHDDEVAAAVPRRVLLHDGRVVRDATDASVA